MDGWQQSSSVAIDSSPKSRLQAAALLTQYLKEQKARGKNSLLLSPEALRALPNLAGNLSAAGDQITPQADGAPGTASPASGAPKAPVVSPSSVSGSDGEDDEKALVKQKALQLRTIRQEIEANPELSGMESLRDTCVFAVGNANADLMFVGEAPGSEEEKQRQPFVGPAGQLLTKLSKPWD